MEGESLRVEIRVRRSHVRQRCMYQRDLGVPFVSFNTRTGHRSSTPEDCGRFVVTLPQGPVPVSGVFPAGVALHLLETGIQAIQLSPYHADPPARRSRRLDTTAGFLACYFPRSPFRITGQPSDPETSPLVPARYASDTTLRLVAQLQHAAAASSAATASATPGIACPRAGSRQDPASTGPRRPDQRVRTCSLKPLVSRHGRVLEPRSVSSCRQVLGRDHVVRSDRAWVCAQHPRRRDRQFSFCSMSESERKADFNDGTPLYVRRPLARPGTTRGYSPSLLPISLADRRVPGRVCSQSLTG